MPEGPPVDHGAVRFTPVDLGCHVLGRAYVHARVRTSPVQGLIGLDVVAEVAHVDIDVITRRLPCMTKVSDAEMAAVQV